MLVQGQWQSDWEPVQSKDEQGRFIRQISSFRNWITPDGSPGPTGEGGFKAEPGRYHLYVALICPWASRALMVRELKGLTDLISVSVVTPQLSEQGWKFGDYSGASSSGLGGEAYLHQIYTQADSDYTGRATVPVLWDKQNNTIVNNESADIIRMLGTAFDELTGNRLDLAPKAILREIDTLNEEIYLKLNNGVYRAGFASTQLAYEEAYDEVFAALDELEFRLQDGRSFLFGEVLTESDIRLFVTLIRFDAAYHGLFKTNRNRIVDMPALSAYLKRVYDIPGVSKTVSLDHIKQGYYSIQKLNPLGIVPKGPSLEEVLR